MPLIKNQYMTIIPHIIIKIYDKCVSNFNERWKLGMTLKPKLRTYIKFKEQIET